MNKWDADDRSTPAGKALFAMKHGTNLNDPTDATPAPDDKRGPWDRICMKCSRPLSDSRPCPGSTSTDARHTPLSAPTQGIAQGEKASHDLSEDDISEILAVADAVEKKARIEEGWTEPNMSYWTALIIEATWEKFSERFPVSPPVEPQGEIEALAAFGRNVITDGWCKWGAPKGVSEADVLKVVNHHITAHPDYYPSLLRSRPGGDADYAQESIYADLDACDAMLERGSITLTVINEDGDVGVFPSGAQEPVGVGLTPVDALVAAGLFRWLSTPSTPRRQASAES